MSRRLAYPALLAAPFLVGVAVLKGLTVEVDTFHASDARLYHLPTILHFSESLDFERYPAAQTPLFHVLFAAWGKLVGFDELWRLRLLNVAISYWAVLVLFRLLVRRGLEAAPACALALLLALSPYYLGASFTLLTDNLAILFGLVTLDRLDRFAIGGSLAQLAQASLALSAAVLTRQSLAWLALVAAVLIVRDRSGLGRKAAGAAMIAAALAPFAALVVTWGDLVPPGSDPASCGLCGDARGGDALTLRTVGFTLALLGLYGAFVFGPSLLSRLRPDLRDWPPAMLVRSTRASDLARGTVNRARRSAPAPMLAAPLAAGALLLLVSPLTYKPTVPGGPPADAGYLWQASDRLPELLGSSLVFWVLVPAGALAVAVLVRRAGPASLPAVYLAGLLVAAVPVALVYQKYFDPFVLIGLALFARPEDLRERVDYAGVAVLGVAFVAYALSFAG